jgi:hypothetical protein
MSNQPSSPVSPRTSALALRWGPRARIVASVLVVLHLLAVLVGPLSVPPSIIGGFLRGFYRPYIEAGYLNHGYKFFGPDPGPSHLVRFELELEDGSPVKGTIPDRAEHWPRLLYHRHFMLSEFVLSQGGPVDPRLTWEQQPLSPAQRAYARSYARHLLDRHEARRVTLYLVEHAIPFPDQVLKGIKLDDPVFYRTRKLGTFEADDLLLTKERG